MTGDHKPTLHIQLLGGCHLHIDGTPITGANTPRLQSFLCFLLVQAQQPQPRHYIAARLWQQSTDAQARTNLRKTLHRLRQNLPDADRYIDVDSNMIHWRPDAPVNIDVDGFTQHLDLAARSRQEGHHKTAKTALEQAIALYNGDLLPACYDDWIIAPREHLHSQYIQALEHLTDLLEAERDFSKAITCARQLLREDTLRESSYRQLMRLYVSSGQRVSALETYQQCVKALDEAMHVKPSAATSALYDHILAGDGKRHHMAQPIFGGARTPQRKQMTIFWTDLAGFSTLAENQDTQTLFVDLDHYMTMLSGLVQHNRGRVIKRMGDGLLAIFADPCDAIHTASVLNQHLRNFNAQRAGCAPFRTRTGLVTDDVYIMEQEQETEIMGHAVNFAAHLQHITPPGGIALDQLTYRSCKAMIDPETKTINRADVSTRTGKKSVYIVLADEAP